MAMLFFIEEFWILRLTKALCVFLCYVDTFFFISSSCREDSAFYRAFWYKFSHNSKSTNFFSCFKKLIKKKLKQHNSFGTNYHEAFPPPPKTFPFLLHFSICRTFLHRGKAIVTFVCFVGKIDQNGTVSYQNTLGPVIYDSVQYARST